MPPTVLSFVGLALMWTASVQQSFTAPTIQASQEEIAGIEDKRQALGSAIAKLRERRVRPDLIADAEIYLKAADWIVRHGEFYSDKYAAWTVDGLERGLERAKQLDEGPAPWADQTGRHARGFVSKVDGSVQPYGLVIPANYASKPERKWRLDVELHGRGNTLNEVSFLHAHDSKQPVPDDQDFIQLDIFGRTNNAYRWAGETDVFEAIDSVKRRYRIDDRRIVLRGFSMGGAGSWHLGLHHPDKWCSVGPGAGFTDTKKYQKISDPLPPWQDATLHVYDAEDYTANAFNVPIVAYGGEDDPQLAASRGIKERLEQLGVAFEPEAETLDSQAKGIPFLFLVGPKMGHQFHPDSRKRAMAFHAAHAAAGTPYFRDRLRFVTYTLKYPGAFGYTIRRIGKHYEAATIDAVRGEDGVVDLKVTNATLLEVSRGAGEKLRLSGEVHNLETAADGTLPTVLFELRGRHWELMDYASSLGELRRNFSSKRPGVQGPIDDAFTGPFLCVRGIGEPWSRAVADYANWSLERFTREWDKWLRGTLPVKTDTEVSDDDIRDRNIVLFGDPGSNRLLARIAPQLPIQWTRDSIRVGSQTFSTDDHCPVLIYPNPLNGRRYVVINSGHTFHAPEFKASNAQLYPQLGDYAVLKFSAHDGGAYREDRALAGLLDESWRLPGSANQER